MARAGRGRGHADHRMERRGRRLHRADRGQRTAVRDLRRAGDGDERELPADRRRAPHLRGPHRRRDRERLRGRRRARVPRPGGAQRPRALQEERVRQRRPHGPVRHRERGHRRDSRAGHGPQRRRVDREQLEQALEGHQRQRRPARPRGPDRCRRHGPEGRHLVLARRGRLLGAGRRLAGGPAVRRLHHDRAALRCQRGPRAHHEELLDRSRLDGREGRVDGPRRPGGPAHLHHGKGRGGRRQGRLGRRRGQGRRRRRLRGPEGRRGVRALGHPRRQGDRRARDRRLGHARGGQGRVRPRALDGQP